MHSAKRVLMIAVSLVYDAGLACLRVMRRRPGGQVEPVVMTYHSVRPEDVPAFERQMRHLSSQATSVFPDDLRQLNGRPTVAVTFDDAFQNVFDNALPVMARHRIPATIFTPTGYLGRSAGWIERAGMANAPALVAANVVASADRTRVRFASHTVTHPRLATLQREVMRDELAGSKRALERLVGEPVTMLSLPYGSFSRPVLEEARAAGYERVFANVPVAEAGTGLVGRINVTPGDWPLEFRLKARGAYGWMALAVPAKRAVRSLLKGTRSS